MKSLITGLLISSLLMLISGTVDASTLASGEKLEVKVDPKKVGDETAALWQRFGAWCAIAERHPAVKKCRETKEGDAVFRTLTLGNGVKIKEKLIDKTSTSYRYTIVESPLPVKNFEAQFSVTPDEDAVNLVWSATYDAADGKTEKDARNCEPDKRLICGYINNLVAGCAGSLVRTRLHTRIPCLRGRNREFQQKSRFLADARRESAR